MKRTSLIVYVILASTFCLIAADESFIKVEFDRFTNETKIIGGHDKFIAVLNHKVQPRLSVNLSFKGHVPSSKPSVTLSLFRLGAEEQYREIYRVYCLADSEPVKLSGIVRRSEKLESGELVEMIAFSKCKFNDFLKLAGAKVVEFKIINHEFKLSAEEMLMLRQVRDEFQKLSK